MSFKDKLNKEKIFVNKIKKKISLLNTLICNFFNFKKNNKKKYNWYQAYKTKVIN